MKYCRRCLYPENHPYGLIFDDQGVCSGCRVHEEKDSLDWSSRLKQLGKLVEPYRNNKTYDCIVPVKGGGDSYFTLHVVKKILGLNPLLVHFNQEYNTRVGIRNLGNLATVFDCDMVTSTVSPDLLKRICRYTLSEFGSMYWHCLCGSLTFPVQVSVRYKIPLIIWGIHPWSDQVGMYSHLDEMEMTEKCRKEHGLMGISADKIVSNVDGITRSDIQQFVYPYENELERIGVRGIYLSNYIRWDSKAQHEKMIEFYGYETLEQQRTFNSYEDVHCFHSAGLHDYIKFIKLGYGKVTDHASREVRLKRMSRAEGIEMVRQYSENIPKDLDMFLEWSNLTKKKFMKCIWNRRDTRIWNMKGAEWVLKDSILNYIDEDTSDVALDKKENCSFIITPSQEPEIKDDNYLLMGRPYMDKYNYGSQECQTKNGGLSNRKSLDYLNIDHPHYKRNIVDEIL